jgi:polysaccharide biosynthesis protein PslE
VQKFIESETNVSLIESNQNGTHLDTHTGNGSRKGRGGKRGKAPSYSALSPRDLLFVLFKHKFKAIAVALTILTLSFLAALLLPSKFRSEAQLQVKPGRTTIGLDATSNIGDSQLITTDFDKQVNTEAALLRSLSVADETVRTLGLKFFSAQDSGDPEKIAAQRASVAAQLSQDIMVTTVKDTQILSVSYESTDPNEARKVVEAYSNAFLGVRSQSMVSPETQEFLSKQSEQAKERLRSIQKDIQALSKETGIIDPGEQKKVLISRIASLQQAIDAGNAELSASIQTVKALEEQLEQTPQSVKTDSTTGSAMGALDQARSNLMKLKQQETEALGKYLPDSIPVKQIRDQIAQAEKQLQDAGKVDGEIKMGLNPKWVSLDSRLKNERANLDALEAKISSNVKNLKAAQETQNALIDVEMKMGSLAMDAGVAADTVKRLAASSDVARSDSALAGDKDAGNVTITQPASMPDRPVSPNRKLLVLFGLFAALAGGTAAAFAGEMLDQSVSRPLDLFKVGFRKVVSVPAFDAMTRGMPESLQSSMSPSPDDDARPLAGLGSSDPSFDATRPTRFVRSTARPGVTVLPQRAGDDNQTAKDVLASAATSEGRSRLFGSTPPAPVEEVAGAAKFQSLPVDLVQPSGRPALSAKMLDAAHAVLERLLFTPVATGEMTMPRSIAVISAVGGQGATTLASHIAAALTDYLPNTGLLNPANKVLLVDANLIEPAIHKVTDVQTGPGMADWLADPKYAGASIESIAKPTAIGKLDVLTAGQSVNGHQPGRWTEAVMAAAQSSYHAVVVDLPNMARCEATARVAGLCDAAIMVVECNNANREVLRQAVERLNESGVRLLGVVLNKRTFPIPEKLYNWI